MSEIYQVIGLTTLATAFVILVMNKTGIRDTLILHAPKLLSKMLSCDFCLGFWLAMAFCIMAYIVSGDKGFLFIPCFSAPLIRMLI